MSHYLGIDVGTYETKGVITDRTGRIVATASSPHRMIVPQPGWAEHRPVEDWWDGFVSVCRSLLAESRVPAADIRAVATSAIGPCMLPVDKSGAPLMNAILYGVDGRAAAEIAELNEAHGEDVILQRCGNALTSQSVGPKILWLKHNRPEIFAKAAKFLTSTSWLVHRLTGRFVVDHYTAANFSPFYMVERQGWSDELVAGIASVDKLADITWTTDIAGHVTLEAAEATGLAPGTPVIAGTIDAASEALSVGVRAPGDMMMMYGSTVFMIELTRDPVRDPRLWYAPWLFSGEHASMAGLATSGTLTHWFRDQFARELATEAGFATLAEEAAASPPGSRGLVFLPYFSGERTPIHDPLAKGVLFGLDLTHTRADIYRALLEGIALATRHALDAYQEAGAPPRNLLAVGGGTKNSLWLQATSDIAGIAQKLRRWTVGAAYGDAFLAALAVGDANRQDIEAWNPVERTVQPRSDLAATYESRYRTFRAIYERTRDLMALTARPD